MCRAAMHAPANTRHPVPSPSASSVGELEPRPIPGNGQRGERERDLKSSEKADARIPLTASGSSSTFFTFCFRSARCTCGCVAMRDLRYQHAQDGLVRTFTANLCWISRHPMIASNGRGICSPYSARQTSTLSMQSTCSALQWAVGMGRASDRSR